MGISAAQQNHGTLERPKEYRVSSALELARSKLPRLLIEGLVVFLGVAAALAGQAWFEERADRRIEREMLANVMAEASENEERAQRFLGRLGEDRKSVTGVCATFGHSGGGSAVGIDRGRRTTHAPEPRHRHCVLGA